MCVCVHMRVCTHTHTPQSPCWFLVSGETKLNEIYILRAILRSFRPRHLKSLRPIIIYHIKHNKMPSYPTLSFFNWIWNNFMLVFAIIWLWVIIYGCLLLLSHHCQQLRIPAKWGYLTYQLLSKIIRFLWILNLPINEVDIIFYFLGN